MSTNYECIVLSEIIKISVKPAAGYSDVGMGGDKTNQEQKKFSFPPLKALSCVFVAENVNKVVNVRNLDLCRL
jgi:hypothetical protein